MRAVVLLGVLCCLCLARPAFAEEAAPKTPTSTQITEKEAVSHGKPTPTPAVRPEIAKARQHFEQALSHYERGEYRRAITELNRALELDPTGKDLVYNLGVVHEKLGEYDAAIEYFERFKRMEQDKQEIARAESLLVRLRGARELQRRERTATPPSVRTGQDAGHAAGLTRHVLDEWVYVTAGVALTALAAGPILGVSALEKQPSDTDRTTSTVSASELRADASSAHRLAVFADIAFAVSLVSGASAAALYFGRDEPAPPTSARQVQLVWKMGF